MASVVGMPSRAIIRGIRDCVDTVAASSTVVTKPAMVSEVPCVTTQAGSADMVAKNPVNPVIV